ncbi:hypothetical protein CVT24_002548 [Panaeolus cyanescens]|uniref:Uncharacterized protein n=1 Tax=Panaeolus cyanescens TaxID=181874 RepID=A0A409YY92_9AGAR|nr:hypothetical protein CVT24_002548 [Panaeolus cyanescens]
MVNICQPISTVLKANLVNTCQQLRLPTHGIVKALRPRLRAFARHHPKLAANPRYASLYPRRRGQRGQGPSSTISADSESSDDKASPEPNADVEDHNHNINDQNAPEDDNNEVLDDNNTSPPSAITASHRASTALSPHNVSVANSRFSTPNNHHEHLASPRSFVAASPPHRSTHSPQLEAHARLSIIPYSYNYIQPTTRLLTSHKIYTLLAKNSQNIQSQDYNATCRSTRTGTPGATISNTAYPPPPRFRQYLRNGWTHHIPLTALTDRACANEPMGKKRSRDEFTLAFRTDGSFTVPSPHPTSLQDQQVDEDDEPKLTFHQ